MYYWHEWYHRQGFTLKMQKRPDHTVLLSEYCGNNCQLEIVHGLAIAVKDLKTGAEFNDTILEEAYAYVFTERLDKKIIGYDRTVDLEDKNNPKNEYISRTVSNLQTLFNGRDYFAAEFQRAHKESDLLGLATFFASQVKNPSTKKEDLEKYGLDILMNLALEEGEIVLTNYLQNLR